MGHSNPKTNATEQRAQIVARRASKQDEIPSVGEEAKEAGFDDDSMFNSADRQSAILQGEQAGRSRPRKKKPKTASKQTEPAKPPDEPGKALDGNKVAAPGINL